MLKLFKDLTISSIKTPFLYKSTLKFDTLINCGPIVSFELHKVETQIDILFFLHISTY